MEAKRKLSRRGFVAGATGAAAAATLGPLAPAAPGHGRGGHHGGDRLVPRDRVGIQLFTVRDQVAALLGFEASDSVCDRAAEPTSATARSSSPATPLRAAAGRTTSCDGCCAGTACAASAATSTTTRPTRRRTRSSPSSTRCSRTPTRSACRTSGRRAAPASATARRSTATAAPRRTSTASAPPPARAGCASTTITTRRSSRLENGARLYDVLLEETDPRLVFFEFEIFWSHVGQSRFPGFKPYEYPWNMPERFPLFHVKDGIDSQR